MAQIKTQEHLNETEFYKELTSRNHHFIEPHLQEKLATFKIFIAGCGSTGGACIEALVRVGVRHMLLADNGEYEISNLNRQHFRIENIGQNKAAFHAQEIKAINPFVNVKYDTKGVHKENIDEYVSESDLVFDAVDVTTQSGIQAKVLLHQRAYHFKKPVLSALDLGFLQWGRSYDYRYLSEVLDGKAEKVLSAKHPIAGLMALTPQQVIPLHCYKLFLDLLDEKVEFASQLGCCSDALSAIIVPVVLQYLESNTLQKGWHMDLYPYRFSKKQRLQQWRQHLKVKAQFKKRLKQLS